MARKQPEQTEIPGTERKKIKALETAERALTEARSERKDAKEAEDKAADKLVAEMRKAEIEVYKFTDAEGVEVTIRLKEAKVKVSVKRKKPAAADEAEAN